MVKSGKILIFPTIALPRCLLISEFWKEDKASHLFLSHFLSVSISCGPKATSLFSDVRWSQLLCCAPSEGSELEAAWSENRAGHYRQEYLFPNGTCWLPWRGRTGHDKNREVKEVISQIFPFGWEMKGQISKPGQHLYACNSQENVSGINWGVEFKLFICLKNLILGKENRHFST